MSKTHKTLLKSGIKVITEEMPDVESVSVGVWVLNGSRNESPKESGISHFIEHLLFKGTKKRTALDIARDIESVGGALNAFTGREYTSFYAKVLNKNVSLAADILSDMLLNSVFKAGELEKERLVVLQEIKMVEDTPDDLIHDLLMERLYPGHPLGSSVLGNNITVGSFTRDDVVNYFGRRYRPDTVFITVAGGIKHKTAVKLFGKTFGRIKDTPAARLWRGGIVAEKPSAKGGAPPVTSKGVRLIKRDLEQVHLCIGVPALPQGHPERYRLYLLNTILGGGMSSRLFQEIREKRGLAYSVYSYLNLMADTGTLVVYAGTSKDDFKKTVNIVLREYGKLGKGISEEELKGAKEQLKGGILLGLDTSESRMMKLARDEICFGRAQPVGDILKAIDVVKAKEVREAARRFLTLDNMTMVAMGKMSRSQLPVQVRPVKRNVR